MISGFETFVIHQALHSEYLIKIYQSNFYFSMQGSKEKKKIKIDRDSEIVRIVGHEAEIHYVDLKDQKLMLVNHSSAVVNLKISSSPILAA